MLSPGTGAASVAVRREVPLPTAGRDAPAPAPLRTRPDWRCGGALFILAARGAGV